MPPPTCAASTGCSGSASPEAIGAGLAQYVHDAIQANAAEAAER